jgi:hypothetical protein
VASSSPPTKRILIKERTGKRMEGLSELLEAKTDPGFVNQIIDNMATPVQMALQGKCGVCVGLGFTDARAPPASSARSMRLVSEAVQREIERGHTVPGANLTTITEKRFCLPVKAAAAEYIAQVGSAGRNRARAAGRARGN